MKVMIVDDHAGVRNMIRQLLAAPGDSFLECATGEAAVQAAREFKPDYVTMDVRLPDLSGLEAARAIRAIHPPSRVIIVTSYDQPFLRQSAIEAGAIACIFKDNLGELRSLLGRGAIPPSPSTSTSAEEEALRSAGVNAPAHPGVATDPAIASRKPSGPDQPLRVLVVEDSENDCELLIRQLRRCGFATLVRRVDNGPELRRSLEQDSWDIIITDNKLPTFSGKEALAMIRDSGLNIPTLCVTGSDDPAKVAEVMDAGACALISKDDLAPLCAAVKAALKLGPASDPSSRSESGEGAVH